MENKDLSYEKKLAILLSEAERLNSDESAKPIKSFEDIGNDDRPLFSAESLADSWNENLAMSAATVAALRVRREFGSVMMPPLAPRPNLSSSGCSEDVFQSAKMLAAECKGVYAAGLKPIIGGFGIKRNMMTGHAEFDKQSIAETFVRPLECFNNGMPPAVIYDKKDEEFGLPDLIERVFEPEYELFAHTEGGDALGQLRKGRRVLKGDVYYGENAYAEWVKADNLLKTGALSELKVKQLIEKNEIIDKENIDKAFEHYRVHECRDVKSDVTVSETDVLKQVAEESVILLKNRDAALPLSPKTKIAIVGNCNADGLREKLSDLQANVKFFRGYDEQSEEDIELDKDRLDEISECSAILYFIDDKRKSGRKAELPSNRAAALDKVKSLGKKIIAVIIGKNPLDMSFDEQCDGVLLLRSACRYSGGAIADIVFGKVNPSGKLSVTYYDDPDRLFKIAKRNEILANTKSGTFFGYRYYSGSGLDVKYPFGYGLSYVNIKLTVIKLTSKKVQVRLTNDSDMFASETVQVYLGANSLNPLTVRPQKELIAFKKVRVAPHDSVAVEIPIGSMAMRRYSVEGERFADERGEYKIWVGTSSQDQRNARAVKISGRSAVVCKKQATDVFSWRSNIKSDGYYIEDGENLMKNSKKLSIVATAMIIATVLIDVCFAIMWIISGLPFGFDNPTAGIALAVLILNHIVLIAGIAVLVNVKKRNKEVEILLQKIKAEKYGGATVLKDDSAKQIFKDVVVPAEKEETEEATTEESAPVYAFNASLKTEDIYQSLRTYMKEKGFVLAPDEVRSIIAAFSSSKLIIVKDVENRRAIIEAAADYFAEYSISVSVGSRGESELFNGESFTHALDCAAGNRDGIVVCEFTGVNEKNCRLFEKMLSYFNSAEEKKQLFFGEDQKPATVTSNVYMVLIADKTTAMSEFSQDLLSCAEWLTVNGEAKAQERVSKYDKIGFYQLKTMTETAENKIAVSEEVWKRVDKFEKDSASLSFSVGNKSWQAMEKYAAMFVSAGGDERSMLDYLVSEKFVPAISLLAKAAGEADSLKGRIEDAFGDEYITKISAVLNEFIAAFGDEVGAKQSGNFENR